MRCVRSRRHPRQVTDIPGISEYPNWSPDGSRIAFHCTFGRILSNGTGDFEICVVNLDGTDLIQLTDTEGENKLPAWSPDGDKIAFQSNRDGWPTLPDYEPLGYDPDEFGDNEIYLMNVDGSGQINLTNNPREGEEFPAWSRDGYIVFSRYGCLMVINADGLGLASIGSCEDGGHFPDWYQPIKTSSTNNEPNHDCSIALSMSAMDRWISSPLLLMVRLASTYEGCSTGNLAGLVTGWLNDSTYASRRVIFKEPGRVESTTAWR